MATKKLVPSAYAFNGTYTGDGVVNDESNMYTDISSDTYAVVSALSKQARIILKGFNFSEIPAGSTVNSYTIRIKFSASSGSISSARLTVVNGTTVIANATTESASSIQTGSTYPQNVVEFNTSSISWDTLVGYGSDLGVTTMAPAGSYGRIFGAEIEVNYTPPQRTISKIELPDGTICVIKAGSLPTVTTTDNGKVLMVVNGAWAAASDNYILTYDEEVSVGTAIVGEAVTGEPNYTPTGTIQTTSAEVLTGGTVALDYTYSNYKLTISGITFTPTKATALTGATFQGTGVNFAIEQEN